MLRKPGTSIALTKKGTGRAMTHTVSDPLIIICPVCGSDGARDTGRPDLTTTDCALTDCGGCWFSSPRADTSGVRVGQRRGACRCFLPSGERASVIFLDGSASRPCWLCKAQDPAGAAGFTQLSDDQQVTIAPGPGSTSY
jgi:hypothetical protein